MLRTTRLAAAAVAAALAVLPLAAAPAQAASPVADTVITVPLPAPSCVTLTPDQRATPRSYVVRNGCAFTVRVRVVTKLTITPSSPCLTLAAGASQRVSVPSWAGAPRVALCTYGPYGG